MAKQTIEQRIARIIKDAEDPVKGTSTNITQRWDKVKESLPDECEALDAVLGRMPAATLDDVPPDESVVYAARDADATLRIYPHLWGRIQAMGLESVYRMDMAVIPMVERMQANGMRVQPGYFERLGKEFDREMAKIKKAIEKETGWDINPDSGDQVAALLFQGLGLKSTKMTKGGKRESTNDKVLEGLAHTCPTARLVCNYREVSKLKSSFCETLKEQIQSDGRVRCNLRITRVSSGRLSASEPNLLAIPVRTVLGKKIREGFVPDDGCVLGSWDLDQIEMRVMAHESRDPVLTKLFKEGKDVHRMTASWMFGVKPDGVSAIQRYAAKRVGFGVITGITCTGLADQMALAGAAGWTEDRCEEAINGWFEIYKAVRSYMENKRAESRRYGFVRDIWGRIRYLPGVWSSISSVREEALRQSHSHAIQAGAQGIIKKAMAEIWKDLREAWTWTPPWRVEPLLQIHDELLFELHDDGKWTDLWGMQIKDRLEHTTELSVPVKAKYSFGPNWGALKD